MLVQLSISDFAIISHLDIHFRPGLNILSGETGAGKSIIISAVNLILGGRASADLIRSGSEEARVEALFELPGRTGAGALLEGFGIPFEGEILIHRTISRGGRNRIMINGAMATLQMLSRVGALLISISGQHEHQILLRPENHLEILDDFGGLAPEREALRSAFEAWQALGEERRRLEKRLLEGEERRELQRFQMEEIDKAELGEDEDRLLEEEKRRLRDAEHLKRSVGEAYELLYEQEDAVLPRLAHCLRAVEGALDSDPRLGGIREALSNSRVELEETALELRDFSQGIVMDPDRLEEVEERLQFIHRLKRKYGSSIGEILGFRDSLRREAGDQDQQREALEKIVPRLEEMERDLLAGAAALSARRREASGRLEKSVTRELSLLEMAGTRFEVRFQGDGTGAEAALGIRSLRGEGYDRVEFMLSPNVGEDLKPLSRIASGGELSRIMLALKTILAGQESVETIIFDEVDAGIGGATAAVVGEKLQSLAGYHQLLCISHLPQIASRGGTHLLVEKRVIEGRTQTVISELDPEQRVREIARLLGGRVVSKRALAHAREMLDLSVPEKGRF